MRLFLTVLISFYQLFISPLLGVNCRHLPSCSQYAKDALKTHGPLRGSFFALKRILRCHPWAEPMVDPVPPPLEGSAHTNKVKG
jgi:putative membrane protein insertion efficiency factor